MGNKDIVEIIRIVWPLIVLHLGLAIAAIIDIVRKKKTRNLSPLIWILISIFFEIFGSLAYFLFGRAEE